MTDHQAQTLTLSGPPVSRWWGPFPQLRQDTLGFFLRCQSYGDVVKLPMGLVIGLLLRQPDAATYVLNHPADVKHVLVTNQDNYRKGMVPPVESRIFGHGVLHAENAMHHHQRRLLLPFFHSNHVTTYTDLITQKAHDLVNRWHDGTRTDVDREMAHLTLSIIWQLLFGQEIKTESDIVREAIAVGQGLIKTQYDSLVASMIPLWVPTKVHRTFNRGLETLEAMVYGRITERRRAPSQHDDLLTLLLAARDLEGHPLTDQEIRDQLMTFLLAGHETTANALTWTWFLLSQFRSVRERLTRELTEVVGDRPPTVADIPHLRYTKMIWDESLRLYPPAWSLHTRVGRVEDHLPSGAVLPAGAWVFVSPWSLHRNPRWFPDPNRFDPERFSDEAKRTHLPYSYIPFGAGGRRCLGESFAEMEGLLILATIAARFQLRLVDGQTILPDPVMTLRPNIPVNMIVRRINTHKPQPAIT